LNYFNYPTINVLLGRDGNHLEILLTDVLLLRKQLWYRGREKLQHPLLLVDLSRLVTTIILNTKNLSTRMLTNIVQI